MKPKCLHICYYWESSNNLYIGAIRSTHAQTAVMVKVLYVQHIFCGEFVFLLRLQYI